MNIYKVNTVEELNYSQLAEENEPLHPWKIVYEGDEGGFTEFCVFTEEGDIFGKAKGEPYSEEGEYFNIGFFNKDKTRWVASSNIGPLDAPYIDILSNL